MKKKGLTSKDIKNKNFSKGLLGYSTDEVDAFLIDVANAVQDMEKDCELLKRKTEDYKVEDVINRAKLRIEDILKKKKEEKQQLELERRNLQSEIDKLRLIQRKFYDRLRMTIIAMSKIVEEIKPDAKGKGVREGSNNGSEGSAKGIGEQNREGRTGKAEGKGNRTT